MHDIETYLNSLRTSQTAYDQRINTVRDVLRLLGNPQDHIPAIHIAGTSGKGSTAYYAAGLLQNMGYSVGLAVSPHVHSVRERSQVNGQPLEESVYVSHFKAFIQHLENLNIHDLSYIECLVVFTYWLFAELTLDYIVIEVGIGGRLDPTNTLTRPDTVRIITDIGLDHTEILGDTYAKIAGEKAGIIHTGNHVVVHQQRTDVMQVVQNAAQVAGASLSIIKNDLIKDSPLPHFQQRNFTLAKAAVDVRLTLDTQTSLSEEALDKALTLTIPGRFEQFIHKDIPVILDVAHNPQKIRALVDSLASRFPATPIHYVVAFGGSKSESLEQVLRILQPTATSLTATTFTSETWHRKGIVAPAQIIETALTIGFKKSILYKNDNPYAAVESTFSIPQNQTGIVVVTGSFYLIDGIRSWLAESRD